MGHAERYPSCRAGAPRDRQQELGGGGVPGPPLSPPFDPVRDPRLSPFDGEDLSQTIDSATPLEAADTGRTHGLMRLCPVCANPELDHERDP